MLKLNQDDLYKLSLGICWAEFNKLIYPQIEEFLTKDYPGFTRLIELKNGKDKINAYINGLLYARHFCYFEYHKIGEKIVPYLNLDGKLNRVEFPVFEDDLKKAFMIQTAFNKNQEYDHFRIVQPYEKKRSQLSKNEMYYDLDYWQMASENSEKKASEVCTHFVNKQGVQMKLYNAKENYLDNVQSECLINRNYLPPFVPVVPEGNSRLDFEKGKTQKIKVL